MGLGAGHGGFVGWKTRKELELERARINNAQQNAMIAAQQRQQELDMRADAQAAEVQQRRRENAWNDAIRVQDMERKQLEADSIRERVNSLRRIGQEEDQRRADMARIVADNHAVGYLSAMGSGGFMRNEQVSDFNKRTGSNYTAIGIVDPLTGTAYKDGGLHFVRDVKGRREIDYAMPSETMQALNRYAIENGIFGNRKGVTRSAEEQMLIDNNRSRNAKDISDQKTMARLGESWSKRKSDLDGKYSMWQANPDNRNKTREDYDREIVDPLKREHFGRMYPDSKDGQGASKSGYNGGNDKQPVSYRYNKARTQRIPVYGDGSQGPIEDVESGGGDNGENNTSAES